MEDQFSRTRILLGNETIDRLAKCRVAVFGVGGVGGYVVEVLARSGIGAIDLIDNDKVSITNCNRQLVATLSTIGMLKIDVAEKHIHDINPHCIVTKHNVFYTPENADIIDFGVFDYVVDCIDTVASKVEIAKRCYTLKIPVVSSMGAANKIDPTRFRVTDISKTLIDPLAKAMRKKLKEAGVWKLKCVWSDEPPILKSIPPASNAYVPAAAGIVVGGAVINDLIEKIKKGTL